MSPAVVMVLSLHSIPISLVLLHVESCLLLSDRSYFINRYSPEFICLGTQYPLVLLVLASTAYYWQLMRLPLRGSMPVQPRKPTIGDLSMVLGVSLYVLHDLPRSLDRSWIPL